MSPRVQRLVAEHGGRVHARFVQITTDGTPDAPLTALCEARVAGGTASQQDACLADVRLRADVEADLALAERLGVDAVPALFVGRSRIVGAVPYATLDSLVRSAAADR